MKNGFQAYLLFDGDGNRIDVAPNSIVNDPTMPRTEIINGISCISCHDRGMHPTENSSRFDSLDVVRDATKNRTDLTLRERALIIKLYRENDEFEQLLEGDRRKFLDALKNAGIPRMDRYSQPDFFSIASSRISTCPQLSGELGLTTTVATPRLKADPRTIETFNAAASGQLDRCI